METVVRRYCHNVPKNNYLKNPKSGRILKGSKIQSIKKIRRKIPLPKTTKNRILISNNNNISEDLIAKYCYVDHPVDRGYLKMDVESSYDGSIALNRDNNEKNIYVESNDILNDNIPICITNTFTDQTWNPYNDVYHLIDSTNALQGETFALEQGTQNYVDDSILCLDGSAASTTITRKKKPFNHANSKDNEESNYLNTNSSVSSVSGLSYAMTEYKGLSTYNVNKISYHHKPISNVNIARKRLRSFSLDPSTVFDFQGSLWNNDNEEDLVVINDHTYNDAIIGIQQESDLLNFYTQEDVFMKSHCTDMTYEECHNIKDEEYPVESCQNTYSVTESDVEEKSKDIVEDKILVKVRFPFYSFELLKSDIDRITENRAMNDSIIDFFLNHLVFHLLDESPSRVHVFPSIFWKFMKETQDDEDERSCDSMYRDIIKSSNRAVMVQQMVACLEGVDLFNFDYLLIPIFEFGHWSLAVVCQPYLLTYCPVDPSKSDDSAAVVFFDSGVSDVIKHFNNAAIITDFIKAQHRITAGRSRQDKVDNEYLNNLSPFDKPKGLNYSVVLPSQMPQEKESTDSGVYLLEYAERFLINTPNTQEILNKGFNFANQYPDFSVKHKRREIMEVVRQFSAP
uniref:ULP_PROTEASE domain-containing protein n=1 Tax=Strongyloides papillosus TaxID=174720 RepID=A0A0N5CFW2_STREA